MRKPRQMVLLRQKRTLQRYFLEATKQARGMFTHVPHYFSGGGENIQTVVYAYIGEN